MYGKSALRSLMRAQRKALSAEEKARASATICEKLLQSPATICDEDSALAVYLASPDEIDLTAVIQNALLNGVRVVAPRWNGETYELARLKGLEPQNLRKGPMGILEPAEAEIVRPQDVSVWIVPGLAFTRDGRRLGYGGGWYDRLMCAARKSAAKIGVAHAFQVVDDLPSEPHDILLTHVVSA